MLGGELANQRRPIALLTCVIYTKYLENKPPSAAAEDFPKNEQFSGCYFFSSTQIVRTEMILIYKNQLFRRSYL